MDCKSNAAACSVEPLRYSVSMFTKDYKVFAFVAFNRPITLGSKAASSSVSNSASMAVGSVSPVIGSVSQAASALSLVSVRSSTSQYRSVGSDDGS